MIISIKCGHSVNRPTAGGSCPRAHTTGARGPEQRPSLRHRNAHRTCPPSRRHHDAASLRRSLAVLGGGDRGPALEEDRRTTSTALSRWHTRLVWVDLDGHGASALVSGTRVYAHEKDPGATDAPGIYAYRYDRRRKTWSKEIIYEGKAASHAPADGDKRYDGVPTNQRHRRHRELLFRRRRVHDVVADNAHVLDVELGCEPANQLDVVPPPLSVLEVRWDVVLTHRSNSVMTIRQPNDACPSRAAPARSRSRRAGDPSV